MSKIKIEPFLLLSPHFYGKYLEIGGVFVLTSEKKQLHGLQTTCVITNTKFLNQFNPVKPELLNH